MSDNEESRYINIRDAAKLLGVTPLTLRNWDKKKKLIAYRHPINNYRVYRLDELRNFLQKIELNNKPKKINIKFIEEEIPEEGLKLE